MSAGARMLIILWQAILACAGTGVHAQEKLPTTSAFELGYSVRSWSLNDGLKDAYVDAFSQSRDGALLFSDSAGVVRYNGIAFEHLMESAAPDVPRLRIIDVHEGRDGSLWTAGLNGQAMRDPDGHWVPIGEDQGGHSGVGKFALAPDGRLWCAVSSRAGLVLSVYEEGRFRPVPREPVRTGYVRELMFDPERQLWLSVAAQAGPAVYRLEGETLVPEPAAELTRAALFRRDDDPRLWLVTQTGIRVREGERWREEVRFSHELQEPNGFSACVVDRDGNYWIATRSLSICVCRPDGRVSRLVSEEVKFPVFVADIFTGRDGTIWFNGENGLLQLRRRPFTPWPQPQRHRRAALRGMAEDGRGTIWFGGVGNYSLRAGEFVRQHWDDDTLIPEVYGIAGRREGGAWFATVRGALGSVSQDGQQMVARPPRGGGSVRDLVEYDGTVWVARSGDLLRLDGGALVPAPPEQAAQDRPICLALGPQDELYVGFREKGLFCRKDGEWSFAGLEGPVEVIAVAPDNTLWARRGESQLCWLREGAWLRTDASEMGIVPQFRMVCSREGSIWFQGLRGPAMRIDRGAAQAWLQGDRSVDLRLRTYGKSEGLPAEQATSGSGLRTLMEDSQNRIWVSTVLGTCAWLPSYDARSTAETTGKEPMPVLIEKVLLDDVQVVPADGVVTVAPGRRRLEIHYAGLDLASPESVTYQYRIEGYQDEWVEVGNRHTAYIQSMPPGSYQFRVIAADRHGVWNEAGASLAIVVKPLWWERNLFRTGAPFVLATALLGLTWMRIRSVRRRALERARLQDEFSRGLIGAQESERARIAGELHDDLGQDLLVMKSRIDLSHRRSKTESEREMLKSFSHATAEVLQKTRRLSHQLRPLHLDHLGLAASVKSLVKDAAEAAKLDYEVEADDNMEEVLDPEAVVAAYRMVQEALSNVIKHAGANSVKVGLRRRDSTATITISDDGCGFDGEIERLGRDGSGHGLKAIKERCALIGGSLNVSSAQGEGTLIRIEIPARAPGVH